MSPLIAKQATELCQEIALESLGHLQRVLKNGRILRLCARRPRTRSAGFSSKGTHRRRGRKGRVVCRLPVLLVLKQYMCVPSDELFELKSNESSSACSAM